MKTRWQAYLPMDCPLCGRRRLEYRLRQGADGWLVDAINCEKCGSEWPDAEKEDGGCSIKYR